MRGDLIERLREMADDYKVAPSDRIKLFQAAAVLSEIGSPTKPKSLLEQVEEGCQQPVPYEGLRLATIEDEGTALAVVQPSYKDTSIVIEAVRLVSAQHRCVVNLPSNKADARSSLNPVRLECSCVLFVALDHLDGKRHRAQGDDDQ